MNTYIVKYINQSDIKLESEIWNNALKAEINNNCICGNSYLPNTKANIIYNDKGIMIKFETDELPYVKYFNHNDQVNRDSCLEFFFNPDFKNDKRYFNFEINAAGVLSIGIGESEYQRERIYCTDYGIFDIENYTDDKGWKIKLFIPFEFVNKYYNNISNTIKGNLYKCGDRTPKPHYGAWSPILTEKPEFHRPEYFGDFILENYKL